jgi:hypothetical protein
VPRGKSLFVLWRDNLDENGAASSNQDEKRRPWQIMVAPNPEWRKPLVMVL